MKKNILITFLPLLAIVLFIAAQGPAQQETDLGWPDDVVKLFERSCNDCHTAESGNIKAKGALNFDKWEGYKITKKINKLNGIAEEVKEKSMPPNKYIKNNPDAVLTDEEITLITNWANAEADKLLEE